MSKFKDHYHSDPDSSVEEDPTLVLKVFKEFNDAKRKNNALMLKRKSQDVFMIGDMADAGSSKVGRKLEFEEETKALEKNPKIPRFHSMSSMDNRSQRKKSSSSLMEKDPFEGLTALRALENRSFRSKNSSDSDATALKSEISKLQTNLAEKEAEIIAAKVQNKKFETYLGTLDIQYKKDKLRQEEAEKKRERERTMEKELRDDLEFKIKKLEREIGEEKTSVSDEIKYSNRQRNVLEDENERFQIEITNLNDMLTEMKEIAEVTKLETDHKISEMQRENQSLLNQLSESQNLNSLNEVHPEEVTKLKRDLDAANLNLSEVEKKCQRLESELQLNEDATLERNAMRERLLEYPKLVKENNELKKENSLLKATIENNELLKHKVSDLTEQLNNANDNLEDGLKAKTNLQFAMKKLKLWESLAQKLVPHTNNDVIVSPDTLETQMAELQQKKLSLQEELENFKSSLSCEQSKVKIMEENAKSLEIKLQKTCKENQDQTDIIRKFRRKLLLVSKERDSYKGLLDSYEKELTFTGGQFEQDRISSLEQIVKNHQDMIEDLENQLSALKGSDAHETQRSNLGYDLKKLEETSRELEEAKAKIEILQMELRRLQIKGDYDPTTTKVLHFRNNPASQSVEMRGQQFKKLQDENESLKARVKLLEEGHSKDLTLLVGQKMDEGVTSQQVLELQEQLKSAEVKKERLIEAFRKTSHEFREICCQLTGFRIDGLANHQYRLSPIYAENEQDNLLFKRDEGTGVCHMLETPFSSQLGDFIDLHLKQQHSIPVFLAAITMDLFSRRTFDTTSMIEESQGDDDDPICID